MKTGFTNDCANNFVPFKMVALKILLIMVCHMWVHWIYVFYLICNLLILGLLEVLRIFTTSTFRVKENLPGVKSTNHAQHSTKTLVTISFLMWLQQSLWMNDNNCIMEEGSLFWNLSYFTLFGQGITKYNLYYSFELTFCYVFSRIHLLASISVLHSSLLVIYLVFKYSIFKCLKFYRYPHVIHCLLWISLSISLSCI